MDWLKDCLGDAPDQDGIIEAVKKALPNHFVSKEQYTKKVTALETATAELETANAQITETGTKLDELSRVAETSEESKLKVQELTAQIEQHQKDTDSRVAEVELNYTKKDAIKTALGASKFNSDIMNEGVSWFDLGKVTKLEDGGFDGIESQLAKIKETKPTLFATESIEDPAGEPPAGDSGNPSLTSFRAGIEAAR